MRQGREFFTGVRSRIQENHWVYGEEVVRRSSTSKRSTERLRVAYSRLDKGVRDFSGWDHHFNHILYHYQRKDDSHLGGKNRRLDEILVDSVKSLRAKNSSAIAADLN